MILVQYPCRESREDFVVPNKKEIQLRLSRVAVDLIKRPDRFEHLTRKGRGYLVASDLSGEHLTLYSSIPAQARQQIEVRIPGGAPATIQVLQCHPSHDSILVPASECPYRLRCRWTARPILKSAG